MKDYIEKAHLTSAPVEHAMERIAGDPTSLEELYIALVAISRWSKVLDAWKAWAFYGKGDCPLASISNPVSPDPSLRDMAAHLIHEKSVIEVLHATVGIGSEAGEMCDAFIPTLFNGLKLDTQNIHEETGDLAWYMAKLLRFTGSDFETIMAQNIAKLKARYPDSFTEADAANRDVNAEKSAMSRPGASVPMGASELVQLLTDDLFDAMVEGKLDTSSELSEAIERSVEKSGIARPAIKPIAEAGLFNSLAVRDERLDRVNFAREDSARVIDNLIKAGDKETGRPRPVLKFGPICICDHESFENGILKTEALMKARFSDTRYVPFKIEVVQLDHDMKPVNGDTGDFIELHVHCR